MKRSESIGFAEGLLMVLLEDLRGVRAHTDMRTQTHTTLQISTLVAAGALVGGFFGLQEHLGDISNVLLLTPIPFFVIATQYIEVSYQVYIAESYINRRLRPAVFQALELLAEQEGGSTGHPPKVPSETLMFEWFADHTRRSARTATSIAALKGLWSTLTPIMVFLGLFAYQKYHNAIHHSAWWRLWEWPQYFGSWQTVLFCFYVVNLVAFVVLTTLFVHQRRGLPPLQRRPRRS